MLEREKSGRGMLRRLRCGVLGSRPAPVSEQKVSPIRKKRVSWFLQSQNPLTLHLETVLSTPQPIPEIFLPHPRTTNQLRSPQSPGFLPNVALDSEPHCSRLYCWDSRTHHAWVGGSERQPQLKEQEKAKYPSILMYKKSGF